MEKPPAFPIDRETTDGHSVCRQQALLVAQADAADPALGDFIDAMLRDMDDDDPPSPAHSRCFSASSDPPA